MLTAAVLFAQYAGTLDFSDTTRLAARFTNPAPIIDAPRPEEVLIAADLSNTAAARLGLTDRRWAFALTYSPTLTLPDIELGIHPLFIQNGGASIGWSGRRWRFALSETGSYGLLNSAFLYPQPAAAGPPAMMMPPAAGQAQGGGTTPMPMGQQAGVQAAPAPVTIGYGSSTTGGAVSMSPDNRLSLSLSGGYTLGGGLGTFVCGPHGVRCPASQIVPQQRGATVGGSVASSLSRRDSLSTGAGAQESTTSGACLPQPNGVAQAAPRPTGVDGHLIGAESALTSPGCGPQDAESAQVTETFSHSLSRVSGVTATGGASAGTVITSTFAKKLAILPIAGASFFERLRSEACTLSAQLAPQVDLRTGLLTSRVQATVGVVETVSRELRISGSLGVLQSVPITAYDPYPITAVTAGLEARFALDRQVYLGVGEQTFWQAQSGYGNLLSAVGFVSVTAATPTLKF
jgi:hypothetical protein